VKSNNLVLVVVGCAIAAGAFVWYKSSHNSSEHVSAPASHAKLRLVNVLDKALFDDAHIKGSATVASVNVPFVDPAKFAAEVKDWDKSVPVVTYCTNYFCTASGEAAEELMKLGFTNVFAYEAGMAEWVQLSKTDAEYAVEGPATNKVWGMVVPKPEKDHGKVHEISSQELQKMIKDVTLS
jgi:rhodanese-related sulfurtransferase